MKTKLILLALFATCLCSRTFGQQSPAHFPLLGGTGGLTNYFIPTINSRLFGILDGITTTNDGFGGIFIYNTNDTTAVNATNVFAPGTGQGGRWQRLLWPGGGGTAPFGPVGGDLSGSLPNPTVAKINGVTLGGTTATAGNILVAENGVWQSLAMTGDATISSNAVLTLANVVSAATGTKITANAKGLVTTIASAVLASADFANQGTTTTVLHGNAAGNPSWSAVSLTADVSGDLPFANIAQIADNSILGNFTGGVADIQVLTSITSANLLQILSNETGTGVAVFNTAPIFQTSINTPAIVSTNGPITITPGAGYGVNVVMSTTGDFTVNPATTDFTVDTSSAFVGVGTVPDTKLTVYTGTTGAGLKLIGGAVGSANAVSLDFSARNGATQPTYARVGLGEVTATVGDETGYLTFSTINAGALAEHVRISQTGTSGFGFTAALAKVAVNGGVHIGGESNPGDNNLEVDGTSLLTGLITATASLTYPSATANTAVVWNGSKTLISSVTTLTELSYVSGVTGAIQTQLNLRVVKPIYGTADPNVAPVAGEDGQRYHNTSTGDSWTYWVGINSWQP